MEAIKKQIESKIASVEYYRVPNTNCMIASLILHSGAVITGTADVVYPQNFDEEEGRKVAYQNAFYKLCDLENYRAKAAGEPAIELPPPLKPNDK